MSPDELELLRVLLQNIDNVLKNCVPLRDEVWPVGVGSSLAGDDAKASPYHLSHSVQHALQVALDHLQCLRSALVAREEPDRISVTLPIHAGATLVRGALENSARAIWLLAPAQRLERVRRRLALQADDHKQNRATAAVLTSSIAAYRSVDPDSLFQRTEDEQKDQLVRLLLAAGWTSTGPKDTPQKALKWPTYAEVVREAGASLPQPTDSDRTVDMGKLLEYVWKTCSALAHGDFTGSLSILGKEIQAEYDGVSHVRLTGSVYHLQLGTSLACLSIITALKLHEQRSRQLR
ncbi:hypothetical protein [Kitasatospora sp. NBC_00315]|uniref:hypothetical protein n=1 Tax=Kitasatospora sp. NBC_00315 TaxID=2975963 RepID=UPI00324531AF